MFTSTARLSFLLPLLLAFAISTTACNSASNSAWIKPDPPRVSCKAKVSDYVPDAPRKNEWTQATADGGVTLSEKAATFVAELLGMVADTRGQQRVTNGCLDGAEQKGLIRQ